MKRRALIVMLVLSLLVSGSGMVAMAEGNYVAIIDGIGYSTLEAVQQQIDNSNQGIIELQQDIGELKVDGREVYVDLNGHDIDTVTVTNNGVFYGSDSQTNDFTVEDTEGYGTIGSFNGNVQAAFPPVKDGYGYVMIEEAGSASFHYVELRITEMTLRPMNKEKTAYNPGVYYNCAFKGDEVVAGNVTTYGVALSLRGKPSRVGLDKCGYSEFKKFNSGAEGNAGQSTVLEEVMHVDNTESINKRNAGMKVYGQAYLQLKDGGGYIFGKCENQNLQELTEGANKLWTKLNSEDKDGIRDMYDRYKNIMQSWDLSALTGPYAEYADIVEDAVTWYEEFKNLKTVYECKNDLGEYDVEQLRQLVVDTFRLQLSFKWTPNETFVYHSNKKFTGGASAGEFSNYTTLATGGVFRVFTGMPYCIGGAYHVVDPKTKQDALDKDGNPIKFAFGGGNIYKVMNYYDPATGVVDIKKMGYTQDGVLDPQRVFNVLTSNCGGGLNWALSRVSNATKLFDTSHFTPANGALPVGEYTIDESQYTKVHNGEIIYVENAIQSILDTTVNSKATMYKSYAELQPGDILLTDGHVRMCVGVEVDWPEGAKYPNSGSSYVYYIDQNSPGSIDRYFEGNLAETYAPLYTYTQDNGFVVRDLGSMKHRYQGENKPFGTKVSFQTLRSDGYIPLTIPEFCTESELSEHKANAKQLFDESDRTDWRTYESAYDALIKLQGIEEGSITSADDLDNYEKIKPATLCSFTGNFTASYLISNFRITIEDQKGNVVREEDPPVDTGDRSKTNVSFKAVRDVSEVLTEAVLNQYMGYTITIDAMLGTGEWLEVMNAVISSTDV